MNHPNIHPNPTRKRGINSIPAQPSQQVTTSTIAPISRSALAPGSRSHIIPTRMRKRGIIIQQVVSRSWVSLQCAILQKLERIKADITAVEVDMTKWHQKEASKWRLL